MIKVNNLIRHRYLNLMLALVFATGSIFFAQSSAWSHSDPANCSSTGAGVSLSAYRSDGITPIGAGTVALGETIMYKATLSHLGGQNCNYEGGSLTITKPDGVVVNLTGGGIPLISIGSPFTSAAVNYVINSIDMGGDNDFDAWASYTAGTSHLGSMHVSPIGSFTTIATAYNQQAPFARAQIYTASNLDVTGLQVIAGTSLYGKITITPTSTATSTPPMATGTVDFMVYNNSTCTGTPATTQNNVTLVNGMATSAITSAAVNSVSYRVHYDGNANYPAVNSDCVWVNVGQAGALLRTEIHNSAHANINDSYVVVNTPIHARAILSATTTATSTATTTLPTGTVDFQVYNNGTCIGSPALHQQNVAVVNGMAESNVIPAAIWWVSYRAHYDGDANYPSMNSDCEVVNVTRPENRVQAALTSEIHNSNHQNVTGQNVFLGSTIHSKITVATSSATSTMPTGSVTFNYFNNGTCSGNALSVQNDVALVNGMVESTVRTPGLGEHSYRVTYNGDNSYLDQKAVCKKVTVIPAQAQLQLEGSNNGTTNQPRAQAIQRLMRIFDLSSQ